MFTSKKKKRILEGVARCFWVPAMLVRSVSSERLLKITIRRTCTCVVVYKNKRKSALRPKQYFTSKRRARKAVHFVCSVRRKCEESVQKCRYRFLYRSTFRSCAAHTVSNTRGLSFHIARHYTLTCSPVGILAPSKIYNVTIQAQLSIKWLRSLKRCAIKASKDDLFNRSVPRIMVERFDVSVTSP